MEMMSGCLERAVRGGGEAGSEEVDRLMARR